jgi:phenylacetic acid degradation operon negative regulatory protein
MTRARSKKADIRDEALSQLSSTALILSLLSVAPRQTVPVQALIAAGRLFEMSERSIRVALNRLDVDGKVRKLSRGLYGFAEGAEGVRREVKSWIEAEDRVVEWSGAWIAVYTGDVSRADRTRLRRHEGALRLRGFRPFRQDLWIRPDNLRGGVQVVAADLAALGLAKASMIFIASNFSAVEDSVTRALWDRASLLEGYSRLIEELKRSEQRASALSIDQALVETLSIGRYVIRHILLDPLLPKALLATDGRYRLIAQMRQYDHLGQRLWQAFLARYVNTERTPDAGSQDRRRVRNHRAQ